MQTTLRQIEPSATPCSVDLIPPERVADLWEKVAPLLKPAIDRTGGRLSLETVFTGLTNNTFHLWIVGDAAAVTETRVYPTGLKALAVLLLGGSNPGDWETAWMEIEQKAKQAGFVKAEMTGRKGWMRVLKSWRSTTIDMEKDLI